MLRLEQQAECVGPDNPPLYHAVRCIKWDRKEGRREVSDNQRGPEAKTGIMELSKQNTARQMLQA